MATAPDAAPVLNAAATAARAAKRPLFVPPGTYYIDGPVNWRYLDVDCQADIVMRHTNALGITVGDTSSQRTDRNIYIRSALQAGATYAQTDFAYPTVRAIGLKGSYIRTGAVSFLQLYANGQLSTENSLAYNTLETQRVNKLELWGENDSGWVNENLFLGGSFVRITVGGSYPHNQNKWVKPSLEGNTSLVDIQRGTHNVFEDARTEGGARIKFGSNTRQNLAIALYQTNSALLYDGFILEEDLGEGNVVTTRQAATHRPHTIMRVDRHTPLFDTASTVARADGALPIPSVGLGKLGSPSGFGYWFDTGIFSIEQGRAGAVNETTSPLNRIERFNLTCDAAIMRPQVRAYDANGVLISPQTTPWMNIYGGWVVGATTYSLGSAVNGAVIYITNPAVKYLSVRVNTPSSLGVLFDHMTLIGYAKESHTGVLAEAAARAVVRPLYGTAQPTRGLAWPGTVVQGPSSAWKATARAETTLASAAEAGATTLTVAAGSGITTGDVIGVQQSDGSTHWSTVSSITGAEVVLSAALPVGAASGAAVGTTRWATVSGG